MSGEYWASVVLVINISIACATLVGFIYIYLKHRIRVLLYWSVVWVFFILTQLAFYNGDKTGIALFYSLFAGSLIYGVLKYLRGYMGLCEFLNLEITGFGPPIFTIYGILLSELGLPYNFSSFEVPFVVLSGLPITFAGSICVVMCKHNRNNLYVGVGTIAFGILTILYPVAMSFARFCPIWKLLGTIISSFVAFFLIKLASSREFLFFEKPVQLNVSLEPGANLITPWEYERMKTDLKDYPVLAFVRDLQVPEKWRTFYLSNSGQKGFVSPTNLAYLIQIAHDYFREAKEKGVVGVVVIDSPEYLVLYNGFEAVVKFLATLADLAMTSNGTLFVVVERGVLDERQIAILRRVFGRAS